MHSESGKFGVRAEQSSRLPAEYELLAENVQFCEHRLHEMAVPSKNHKNRRIF